jgi:hypothetical protein
MSLATRVSKLEAAVSGSGNDGTCTCQRGYVSYEGGSPWREPSEPLCPNCGLLPVGIVRYVGDFYRKLDRLEEPEQRESAMPDPAKIAPSQVTHGRRGTDAEAVAADRGERS